LRLLIVQVIVNLSILRYKPYLFFFLSKNW